MTSNSSLPPPLSASTTPGVHIGGSVHNYVSGGTVGHVGDVHHHGSQYSIHTTYAAGIGTGATGYIYPAADPAGGARDARAHQQQPASASSSSASSPPPPYSTGGGSRAAAHAQWPPQQRGGDQKEDQEEEEDDFR